MRSAEHVKGVPHLYRKDRNKVDEANKFVEFTLSGAAQGANKGIGQVIENPGRSWLWSFLLPKADDGFGIAERTWLADSAR